MGRLVRARRWDSTSAAPAASASVPTATAAIDLRYRYDASDQRVIKRTYNTNAASQRHTLYLFGSLEVHRTLYASNAYTVDSASLVPCAIANGGRLARLHYDAAATVPQVAGLPTAQGGSNTGATLHVLLELGDHLGSTGTVLDKVSSELVEKTGYLPFGGRENDYRPSRWNGFGEDYGFTGKEEDVEVGLTYFGKRFLSPQLGRWVSADPLAVHAPGEADLNLYAYVSGAVLKSVDPVGLDFADYVKGLAVGAVESLKAAAAESVKSNPAVQVYKAGEALANGDVKAAASHLAQSTPLGQGEKAAIGFGQSIAALPGQVKDAVNTPSDFETGRKAFAPVATIASVVGMVYGGVRGGSGPGGKTPHELAKAQADIAREITPGSARPPTVATFVKEGTIVEGQTRTGTPHTPEVQNMLDNVPQAERSKFHGGCAEMNCLDNTYRSGVDPRGGEIGTAKVRVEGSAAESECGTSHEPCSTCANVMDQAGVKYSRE